MLLLPLHEMKTKLNKKSLYWIKQMVRLGVKSPLLHLT